MQLREERIIRKGHRCHFVPQWLSFCIFFSFRFGVLVCFMFDVDENFRVISIIITLLRWGFIEDQVVEKV